MWPVVLLFGCAHRIEVSVAQPGARIEAPHAEALPAPAELSVSCMPFRGYPVTVSARGHRKLAMNLRPAACRAWLWPWAWVGSNRVRQLEIHLVRRHGPAGTWTEDDLP